MARGYENQVSDIDIVVELEKTSTCLFDWN
jgi:predicted nucleotidyltransferase